MKFKRITAALLAGIMLMDSVPVFAKTNDDEILTQITYKDESKVTVMGMISDMSEDMESYSLISDGETLLTVTEYPVSVAADSEGANGYYSAEFTLPSGDTAYIAGLSKSNIETIKTKLAEAKLDGQKFEIDDLEFIDADKKGEEGVSGDDSMCWAAAVSNILHYSGWAQKAGFAGEDEVFDVFQNEHTNTGGHEKTGLYWFFSGGVYDSNSGKGWRSGNSGGYLKDYAPGNFIRSRYFNTEGSVGLYEMQDYLRANCGVSFGVEIIKDANKKDSSAHALTYWGSVTDKNGVIKAILFCDNNDYETNDGFAYRNRTQNMLQLAQVGKYSDDGHDSIAFSGSYIDFDGHTCVLSDYTALLPYSDSCEKETDPESTKDAVTDHNLVPVLLHDRTEFDPHLGAYPYKLAGEEIKMQVDFTDATRASDPVIDENKVAINTVVFDNKTNKEVFRADTPSFTLPALPVGDYTARVTVNGDKKIKEAYYGDNTRDFPLHYIDTGLDKAQLSLGCDVTGESESGFWLNLDLKGIDLLKQVYGEDADYTVYTKAAENEEWTKYCTENGGLKASYKIDNPGGRLFVRVRVGNNSKPQANIIGKWTDGKSLYIEADKNNGKLSDFYVPSQAKKLNEGEKIKFYVINTGNAAVKGDVYLWAKHANSSELIQEIGRVGSYTFEPGRTEITADSWTKELLGSYEVSAGVDYADGYALTEVCKIYVKKARSLIVNTLYDDVDEYDSTTSLREAVNAAEDGDVIVISDELDSIYVNTPIEVTKKITVKYEGNEERVYKNIPSAVNMRVRETLFSVKKGAGLNLSGINIVGDDYYDGKAIICLEDAAANIENCNFYVCRTGTAGGVVAAHNSNVILKNCTFDGCEAAYGSAVYADNSALDILGCTFWGNKSSSGTLYINGGRMNMVNSTLCANVNKYTKLSVNAVNGAQCTLVNCIALGNTASAKDSSEKPSKTISDNVKIYGLVCDDIQNYSKDNSQYLKEGELDKVFLSDKEHEYLCREDIEGSLLALPVVTNDAKNGIKLTAKDGVLYANGVSTGIATIFTDKELSKDIIGNDHEDYAGSSALKAFLIKITYGDADADGKITAADATCIMQLVLDEKYEMPIFKKKESEWYIFIDVDDDDKLTANDALMVLQKVQNEKIKFPCEKEKDEENKD